MVRPTTDDDTGLKVLREPTLSPDAENGEKIIDIVALHGLGAHPDDTWTQKRRDGDEVRWVNWLEEEDMLPVEVPQARIMRYGYKSGWFGVEAIKQSARTTAERFLTALRRERKDCIDRPLILIAHSFGGLVVLKAVCNTYHDRDDWPGVFDAVRGLVFFGTPFRGADGMSQSEMVQAAAREYAAEDIEAEPLHILDPGNELLQDLVDDFQKRVWANMPGARIACFFELKASEIGAIVGKQRRKAFAVDERSGCFDVSDRVSKHSLARTHFNMNKFGRPTEEDYLVVVEVIKKMAKHARQQLSVPSMQVPPVISVPLETTYEQASRRRVKYFRGRQKQLKRLQEYFTDDIADEYRVLILQAMGGQGKSQIALEYCRQRRSTYAEMFWINASSETIAVQSIERVAAEIRQPLTGIDDTRTKIRLVVQALARRSQRWLMVLDNYDDPDHFTSIEHFIPSHSMGDILITSRSKGLEGLGRVVIVPPMTNQEGTELLLHDYPTSEVDAHRERYGKIVERLGGLPLALDQAAAFIRYKQLALDQLDEFLSLYEAQREQVLRHTPRRFWKYGTVQVDGKEEDNRAISAFTTWEMSFQQLEEDEARRGDIGHFLTVSAFFQPDRIDESLFRHHWEWTQPAPAWMRIFSHEDSGSNDRSQSSESDRVSDSDPEGPAMASVGSGSDAEDETPVVDREQWNADLFWRLISKAYDLSLLDSIASGASIDGARFSLHPVICDWLQVRLGMEATHEFVSEAIEMAADNVRRIDGSVDYSLQARVILLGHINICLENDRRLCSDGQRVGQELRSCAVAGRLASFYQDHGRYDVAEGLYRQVSDTRRETVGLEDPSTLTSMNNLANALSGQGKYAAAEEMHREILKLRKKVLGEEHPKTLTSMNNLASALSDQGKYAAAEEIYREISKLSKKVLGEEHPLTLTSMNNLVSALSDQGKYATAEEMYRGELKLRKKVLGEEHPDTLTSMNNLASALSDQGKYATAEEIHRETSKLSKNVLGEEHPKTLTSMNNLASALSDQGKYAAAEEIYREISKLSKNVLGEEHPLTLTSMNNLASALSHQGKYATAEEMHRATLELRRKVLGEKHPDTLTSMNNLASALSHQGKYATAEEMHRATLELRRKVLGEEHPDTLTSMNNLAYLLVLRSRFIQAAIFYERAIAGYRRVLGPDHPTTRACAEDYSSFWNSRGNKK
ncbi:hypothetical protein AYL99_09968 [Fonsecaea erecta]|uniref:NB-ARC domain-containing protein n=1 Tax=Fonsecaea erecta TaxID=1367422 RepID=A0A178Z8N7_9EURO|nr:hypothetical protein AYL99_09968 [Fonsecaea erecta]OAP55816.1 hypothetical protein AYL99_09968 [Fonsecaea erecta]